MLFEDGGDFGLGEGAVEFFGAVVDLGLEVGAEFGEDVVAGGGGEVVADGLEVAVEEVGVVGFMRLPLSLGVWSECWRMLLTEALMLFHSARSWVRMVSPSGESL